MPEQEMYQPVLSPRVKPWKTGERKSASVRQNWREKCTHGDDEAAETYVGQTRHRDLQMTVEWATDGSQAAVWGSRTCNTSQVIVWINFVVEVEWDLALELGRVYT
jgi:hypothetical protein